LHPEFPLFARRKHYIQQDNDNCQKKNPRGYFISACSNPSVEWRHRLSCAGGEEGQMEHYSWETVEKEVLNEKMSRKVISGEKVMIAQISIAQGGVVPTHQHESEQLSYVVKGALKFELEGREIVVRQGEVLQIPSNVPHSAVAVEDFFGIDVFSPIRLDWLTGQDDYLRR
jgi:quercetin dioxygenase-like cupin family protein